MYDTGHGVQTYATIPQWQHSKPKTPWMVNEVDFKSHLPVHQTKT